MQAFGHVSEVEGTTPDLANMLLWRPIIHSNIQCCIKTDKTYISVK
jgi:hypothetical protein